MTCQLYLALSFNFSDYQYIPSLLVDILSPSEGSHCDALNTSDNGCRQGKLVTNYVFQKLYWRESSKRRMAKTLILEMTLYKPVHV